MKSLNYTELATAVLALCIFTTLLLGLIIYLMYRVRQEETNRSKEDMRLWNERHALLNKIQSLDKFADGIDRVANEASEKVTNLEKSLIKPKYNISDKIICSDGTRGTIVKIEQNDNTFTYHYKTRKYFNHPSKVLQTLEFGIIS